MNNTMKNAIYLHALTPVHAGTGQVSASVVDLPVAREKATNWPLLPATTIKGVLKDDALPRISDEEHLRLFGGEARTNGAERKELLPGSLQFGDARLLCFPVRAWRGTFAYVTCPLVLSRLKRDFAALGVPVPFAGEVPDVSADDAALVPSGSALVEEGKVWLEDLELTATEDNAARGMAEGIAATVLPEAERAAFVARFLLVSDNLFDFMMETATEVTARIALNDETKTVKEGPFYEEAVPAEAIFVAPVLGKGEDSLPVENGAVLQFGGDASVGRGLCRVTVA